MNEIKKNHVPEVLNVHVNENKKKSTFSRRIFFSCSKKLTFEKENVILFNTFFNLNLFYLIVVMFCKFRSHERSELQVHKKIELFLCGILSKSKNIELRRKKM